MIKNFNDKRITEALNNRKFTFAHTELLEQVVVYVNSLDENLEFSASDIAGKVNMPEASMFSHLNALFQYEIVAKVTPEKVKGKYAIWKRGKKTSVPGMLIDIANLAAGLKQLNKIAEDMRYPSSRKTISLRNVGKLK